MGKVKPLFVAAPDTGLISIIVAAHIIQSLKAIGEKNVTQEHIDKIQTIIDQSGERKLIYQNLSNAHIWVQKTILNT